MTSAEHKAPTNSDDGGLGVVRIKPLGAGGGGGEISALSGGNRPQEPSVKRCANHGGVCANGRHFEYPSHVVEPEHDQAALYEMFMPRRVEAFLSGVNVNIMAYGQTGSGKTHTMFGPPGLMARAAKGEFGERVCPEYGLCPRGVLDVLARLKQAREDANGATRKFLLRAQLV